MVQEWGLEDDSLLFTDRLAFLDTPPGGLKLKTDGYEFLKQNSRAGRILKVPPGSRILSQKTWSSCWENATICGLSEAAHSPLLLLKNLPKLGWQKESFQPMKHLTNIKRCDSPAGFLRNETEIFSAIVLSA